MRYPSDFVEQLKNRLLVSEVIGRRIPVRKAGREMMALCPFHKEKTPSFTISDEKGFYHCFGCGAHGDAIGFIKDYEGVSYKEAIERLADEAGVPLPKLSPEVQKREEERFNLQQVSELACQWFQSQLFANEGAEARRYLHARGISDTMIETFRIGYAPPDRQALLNDLKGRNIQAKQLVDAGLFIALDGKTPYARFRDRIMFPIRSRRSQVVAFGGRLLSKDPSGKAPKYVNSPETELFHKGHMLYNQDLVMRPARDGAQIVIAEGYTDVIALHRAEIPAVAPLGTALTADQLQLLWRMTDRPVLCLDGDNAGQRAMQRAMDTALPLLSPGKSLALMTMPEGEDPDTLVNRANGKAAMTSLLDGARDVSEALWAMHRDALSKDPSTSAAAEEQLMGYAMKVQHPTMRKHLEQFFKQKLYEVRRQSYQSKPNTAFRKPGKGKIAIPARPTNLGALIDTKGQSHATQSAARQILLCLCLEPSLLSEADAEDTLSMLSFESPENHTIQSYILSLLSRPSDSLASQAMAEECPEIKRFIQENQILNRTHLKLAPQLIWRKSTNSYIRAMMETEIKVAERAMEEAMTEETLRYFENIKKQKQLLDAERDEIESNELALASAQAS